MKIGSLCTGYGGLDMAVEAYFEAETVWTCEFDKHASKIIQERFGKHNYGNLKLTDWSKVEPIDILTAGYPCQPFSHAGSRKGAADERHLWPYIKEIIRILRPQFVVLENVRGHFGLGFREVLGDLTEIGYDARWTLIRASDVGAPHRRERLFILAHSNSFPHNHARRANTSLSSKASAQYDGANWQKHRRGIENVIDSSSQCITHDRTMQKLGQRFTSRCDMHLQEVPPPLDQGKLNAKFVEYMMGLPNGWVTDVGLSRAQQLKILGNGVVPQQAFRALELLLDD